MMLYSDKNNETIMESQLSSNQRAAMLKEEGNKLFTDKKFFEAITRYSQAIELNPEDPVFYTNRAFAYIKTEMYQLAKDDTSRAIEIDSNISKAYYRRALAQMNLLNFKDALLDLDKVIKLEPNDKSVKAKYTECEKTHRRISFEKAISVSRKPQTIDKVLANFEKFEVKQGYDGPKIDDSEFTLENAIELMEFFKCQKQLPPKYVCKLLLEVEKVLRSFPSLFDVDVPEDGRVIICGDTHGQFYDVVNIFAIHGLPSKNNVYLFNGDFVDRGSFSYEVILTLFAFKVALPNHFHLTRGNHETLDMNRVYGFEGEARYKGSVSIFEAFTLVFDTLPIAAVVGKKIFVVHGGLPRVDDVTLDDIRAIDRFHQPKDTTLMFDLLWADPHSLPGRWPSKRGVCLQFGPDITKSFLELNNLEVLVRSHEVKENGYEIEHDGKCITIFSAPNYCDTVGNKGAVIYVTPDLKYQFKTFDAVPHPQVRPMQYSMMSMY